MFSRASKCAFEFELIVCVGCNNYVLVNVTAWFYFWVQLIFVHPYLWVVIIGSRGSLGLVQCPLLFLSANVESIFKVTMETIVFVVAVIGAAGRARLCYFCHESTPDTHIHKHTHAHTQVYMPEYRCEQTVTELHNAQNHITSLHCLSTHIHCLKRVFVSYLSPVLPDILIHLHHDNSSNHCPLNCSTQLQCVFLWSAGQACVMFEVLIGGDRCC